MRLLIVGNGGREHALLWKLRREAPSAELFATRPNGGMAPIARGVEIDPGEVEALAGWAESNRIDLTVVGPEAPLAKGIVDRFRKRGLPIFGPTAAAARIEASKAFAKELMAGAGVPTAAHRTFQEAAEAEAYVAERGAPVVVKASGLAAGKGALVCATTGEAVAAIREIVVERRFGEAGREVVVEEFMEGEELSVFAIAAGEEFLTLVPSQDHKRIGEGDTGPNTGGMGAYAPVSVATPELVDQVERRILGPTLTALAEEGSSFTGLLYAGLMLTEEGPKVVEFNCRFGDPEAQVVLPLVEDGLLDAMVRVAEGGGRGLAGASLATRAGAAVTTVLASAGYPGSYEKGKEIHIPLDLEAEGEVVVFHAGTRMREGILETSGGRVLAVTGLGSSVAEARQRSLAGAERIEFEGRYLRRDIAWRELERTGSRDLERTGSSEPAGASGGAR